MEENFSPMRNDTAFNQKSDSRFASLIIILLDFKYYFNLITFNNIQYNLAILEINNLLKWGTLKPLILVLYILDLIVHSKLKATIHMLFDHSIEIFISKWFREERSWKLLFHKVQNVSCKLISDWIFALMETVLSFKNECIFSLIVDFDLLVWYFNFKSFKCLKQE